MKTWPLILIIILIPAVLAIRHTIAVNTYIEECTQRTTQQSEFLDTLRTQDSSRCASFDGTIQQRCLAYIAKEPSLCAPADLDCIAISSKNASLCVEPTCRALASGDTIHCQELSNPTYCNNLATLNAEAFVPNREACKDSANIPWF